MRFELTDEQRDFAASLDSLLAAADTVGRGPGLGRRRPRARAQALGAARRAGRHRRCRHRGRRPVERRRRLRGARPARRARPLGRVRGVPARRARPATVDGVATVAVPPHVPYALDADVADEVVRVGDDARARDGRRAASARSTATRRLFAVTPGTGRGRRRRTAPSTWPSSRPPPSCSAPASGCWPTRSTYVKQRKQFGREIGSYQAIKHALADVRIALDFARPLVYGAAARPRSRDVVGGQGGAPATRRTSPPAPGSRCTARSATPREFDLQPLAHQGPRAASAPGARPATTAARRCVDSPGRADGVRAHRGAAGARRRPSARCSTKRADSAAVRAAIESETGYDEALWQMLCEQIGVAALPIPEEYDGAGASLFETAVVLEELGRSLAPSPAARQRWSPPAALLAGGDDDASARLLPRIAAGEVATVVLDDGPCSFGDRGRDRARRPRRRPARARPGAERPDLVAVDGPDHPARSARRDRAARRSATAPRRRARPRWSGRRRAALQVGLAARALDMTVAYTRSGCSSAGRSARSRRSSTGWPTCWSWSRCRRSASWAASVRASSIRTRRRRRAARPHVAKAYCSDALDRDRRRDGPAARRHRDHLGARRPPGLQARARPRPAVRPGAPRTGRWSDALNR